MTLVSVTAYHSFSGEVEASNTPTIRRLTPSCRHQLPRIALAAGGDAKAKIEKKRRYGHNDIKVALIDETKGKCAYCESKILHVVYGDIEHVTPKAIRPELSYEWSNLTLACDICNTKKSSIEGLVDPYTHPLDTCFRFVGPMITAVPGHDPARATVVRLDLNRSALLEKRKEKLDQLWLRLIEIRNTSDEGARSILSRALLDDARDAANEFAACAAEYIEILKSDGHITENNIAA